MSDILEADTLRELMELQNPHALNSILDDVHAQDIADAAVSGLDSEQLWELLRQLDAPRRGEVFARFPLELQVDLAAGHNANEVADLLERMPSDDRADLVQALPEELRAAVLGQMEAPQRADAERLAAYPPGTVGAVMSGDVATLSADMTVDAAISQLRILAEQKETIYYNYVVDAEGKLLGIVSLRELVLSKADTLLADAMNREPVSVLADESAEQAARLIREYDLLALPVVDGAGRLLGIVTVDDLIDVAADEATEDFHKFGATGLGKVSFADAGVWFLYRRRIVWLIVLVFVNVFSGAGIAAFEDTIALLPALVFFLPLLIDSGGNAGSQSATMMVRALATGEVQPSDWLKILGKEFAVSLALGITMALGVGLVGSLRAPHVVWAVVPTMVLIVLVGSMIGMLLPFLLTKLKMDPATASGPLITSLADISGVLIYFSLATWLLREQMETARTATTAAGL
jgi:magnesium transporter